MPVPKNLEIPKELENRILKLESIPLDERVERAKSVPIGIFYKEWKTKGQITVDAGLTDQGNFKRKTQSLELGVPSVLIGIRSISAVHVYYSPEEQEVMIEISRYNKKAGAKKKEAKEEK